MYRSPRNIPAEPTQRALLAPPGPAGARSRSARLRLILLFSSLALFAAPVALLEPSLSWADDPELFRLLRGMAVLKGLMALAGLALVGWRVGRAIEARMAMAYILGACGLALASGLIWELQVIPVASTLFHGAILALLITAWRDSGSLDPW
jgi:hypothetical protein